MLRLRRRRWPAKSRRTGGILDHPGYSPPGSPTVIVRCIFHEPSAWRCRIRISFPPPENTSPEARDREIDRWREIAGTRNRTDRHWPA